MEGNELDDNKCVKCKQTCSEEYYKCDSCLHKIHKKCANINPSEVRCMPLQKRVLLLICDECRMFMARMPFMMKLLEEMRKDIDAMKLSFQGDTYANVLQSNPNKVNI